MTWTPDNDRQDALRRRRRSIVSRTILSTGNLSFIALALGAIMASTYLILASSGQAPSRPRPPAERSHPAAAPAADSSTSPSVSPSTADTSSSPSTSPDAAATGPSRPPLPLEEGGPFGSRMTTGTREVALTFDDGPDPQYTPQVLETLRRYDVKATFCLVGINVRAYPELVREIVAAGHTLCNHSWRHDLWLGSRSRDAIEGDIEATNEAIREAAPGAHVSYYRQPGGYWTAAVVDVAQEFAMTPLHWEVDPQDWRVPGAANVAETVTSRTLGGAIVLLHDGGGDRSGTVAALDWILPNLTRRFQLSALPPAAGPAQAPGPTAPVQP